MSIKVTLNKLLSFVPNNEDEEKLFKIDKSVLTNYHNQVLQSSYGIFYLGGYIKLTVDDDITLSQIEEIIKLNNKNIESQCACNSWEMSSLFIHGRQLQNIKIIVEKYQEICRLRESETDI